MTSLASPLGRKVGRSPWNEGEIESAAAAAWHKKGLVLVRPEDLQSEGLRMALEAHAIARWGKRKETN